MWKQTLKLGLQGEVNSLKNKLKDLHSSGWIFSFHSIMSDVNYRNNLIHLFDFVHCREPAWGVPPVAKVMRLRGPTGKGESSLKGASLNLLVHLPQKPEFACLAALCLSPYFWHYEGLSPTTSLCKGVNLGLLLINLLGVFQSQNSSDGFLACLTRLSGHMWLFTASQPWEARDALNFLKTDSFEKLENY